MTAEEALPLIHALLLYNSTSFLSENRTERLAGELYLATITTIARQSGLFHPGGDCTTPGRAPTKDWDFHWKNWISHESWRRYETFCQGSAQKPLLTVFTLQDCVAGLYAGHARRTRIRFYHTHRVSRHSPYPSSLLQCPLESRDGRRMGQGHDDAERTWNDYG